MFEISWSELLILGIATLIFVGPKELPVFLRTIGRYTGMIRKQAAEFRAQFDEALRESELDQIRKDVSGLRDEVSGTVRQAKNSVEKELNAASREMDIVAKSANTTALPKGETKTEGTSAADAAAPALSDKTAERPAIAAPVTAPHLAQQDEKSRV